MKLATLKNHYLFTNLVKDTKLKSVSDCMGSGQVNQTVSPPFEFFKIKGAERVTAFTLDDAIYSASDNQVFSRLLIFESGLND